MAGKSKSFSIQPGQWVKGKLIGSGSYGNVHLAMNKATGGLFVVKSSHSGVGIEALENEANLLKSLNPSPYIVQFLGTEKGENKHNVFMEHMAGGSLADVAEKFGGSLEEEVIRLYARDILQGLNHLHKNGILHCDVKCKNVLLGSSGDIKLADFGCAKRLSCEVQKGYANVGNLGNSWQSIGGTPLWMAPEVLRNEGLDYSADIWSLGCTVIEMASGRCPNWGYDISNPMAAVLKIAYSDEVPHFPMKFSKEGLDFLARCLDRDSSRRWTAEELLNHPFVSSDRASASEKECFAGSPSSVLEIRSIVDSYYIDEAEARSCNVKRGNWLIQNPFSRYCGEKRKETIGWVQEDSFFGSSETSWITVRSG